MGLRERKKERTRDAIEDAAFRLFAERGFAATTIADIAEAADIAPRTFFSYFPSKEDVVFAHIDEATELLRERLAARAERETTFDAFRAWIGDIIDARQPVDGERDAVRRRLVCDNEALAAHERHLLSSRFEALIAAAVAEDLDADPSDLLPPLVAAAAVAALRALSPPEGKDTSKPPSAEDLEVLDEALAFLRGGIAALQRRRRAGATAGAGRAAAPAGRQR